MAEIDLGKIGYPLKNNATTETPGEFALDAAMAREFAGKIDIINTNLTKKQELTDSDNGIYISYNKYSVRIRILKSVVAIKANNVFNIVDLKTRGISVQVDLVKTVIANGQNVRFKITNGIVSLEPYADIAANVWLYIDETVAI